MTLERLLSEIREPCSLEVFRPHWDESRAALEGQPPFFLEEEQIRESRAWCGFDEAAEPVLLETARRIRKNEALRLFAGHCYRLLFEHLDYNEMGRWPGLERILGESGGILYLLVAMGMIPQVRAVHRRIGVSEEITRDTCRQIACMSGNYGRMTKGRLGFTVTSAYWLRHYTAGRLFRVGRMEYMIRPFWGQLEAYRHRSTGRVIALANEGTCFNEEGYMDADGWQASLAHTEGAVSGCPIAPQGYALRQAVSLPLDEWECVLKPGDATLDMHIPAGGGMTPERCADSMRRAVPFFRAHFPDEPFRVIACYSWIFNTQFEEVKLSSDNLVAFQRELYLFPIPSSGTDGLWFIFLKDDFDPVTLPRDTSLQRSVADYLAQGNRWRGGGMFYLTDDLDHFGEQHYRRSWGLPDKAPV
ncbi:MAG: DUF5596 domain-containing protein [Armatimonadetes bacterium]|nr:DUF5596 domain-containing protein [Armatimonadota bacterium]